MADVLRISKCALLSRLLTDLQGLGLKLQEGNCSLGGERSGLLRPVYNGPFHVKLALTNPELCVVTH